MTRLEGRCFCGKITFAVEGPERYACFCHCESCQRASGGAYVPWATFARSGFTITAGELSELHSSPGVTRGFCRDCGTALTYAHDKRRGDIDITLTSFDDPSAIEPRSHIWLEDKQPWVRIDDGLPQYQQTAK